MSNTSALGRWWNLFWESEEKRIDRQRILLDLLWHTPIPTDEVVALIANNNNNNNTSTIVKQRDENDNYPIHVACSNGAELAVLQALVEAWPRGLSLVESRDFETPLHLAVLRGMSVDCIQYLGDAYPQAMRLHNRQNDLPLHLACRLSSSQQQQQKLQVIQYLATSFPQGLVKKGKRGNLPLHLALSHRASLAVVQALATLELITIQNREGETVLHTAVANDVSLDILLYLLETFDTSKRNEALLLTNHAAGDTVLHVAVRTRGRNLATIQVVAESNRQALLVRNKHDKTPLEVAQDCGADNEIVQWLSNQLDTEQTC